MEPAGGTDGREPLGISPEFERTLPRKLMASGVLFRDAAGHVLLVKATYRDKWTLPGGVVERGESPRDGARREVFEELGIDLSVGRLLVVDHKSARAGRLDAIQWIFDGGLLQREATDRFAVDTREIAEWSWIAPDAFGNRAASWATSRLHAAVRAVRDGQTLYLEDGHEPDTTSPR